MTTEQARVMRKLTREGRVIAWRRPTGGARIQVLYPHDIVGEEFEALVQEIKEVADSGPDGPEMLPRNTAVNGTEFQD